MIRFIVCNYDLVQSDNGVSPELVERILKLKEKGILFSVACRDNYDSIRPYFESLTSDMLFICDNGTVAFFDDENVYKYYHERRVAFDIIREARKLFSCNIVVNGEKSSYTLDGNKGFVYYLENEQNIRPVLIPEIYKIREDIVSVRLYKYGGLNEEVFLDFKDKWKEKADFVSRGDWIDILPVGVDKGLAISTIQKLYGISYEDTLTFGIDKSDICMFENSFFSYAMQQADVEIRNCAKHIASDMGSIIEDILLM